MDIYGEYFYAKMLKTEKTFFPLNLHNWPYVVKICGTICGTVSKMAYLCAILHGVSLSEREYRQFHNCWQFYAKHISAVFKLFCTLTSVCICSCFNSSLSWF